ncbi:MAG: NAD(P)-dependent oxidoreductase [Nitrospirae bacterium]|nr:NAD(P)-dependent oxidoreductase [Nitrospirota bacterium]
MILVAGGNGYLGRHLVRALSERGESVRVFDRVRPTALPERCVVLRGDVRDADKCRQAVEGCSVVFHLVGIMPQAKASETLMHQVNVGGTANLLKASVEAGVKRFVFLSSMEVYGASGKVPLEEGDQPQPIGEYGRNKQEAEALCLDTMKKSGLEVVILRPSTIVGRQVIDHQLRSLLNWVARKWPLVSIGNGHSRFQMSSLQDCVSACLLAVERQEASGQVFNIGADDPPSIREFMKSVRKLSHNPFPVLAVPAKPIKWVLAALDGMGISAVPPDHFKLLDATFVMDCNKAKRILGWRPTQSNLDMFQEAYQSFVTDRGRES